MTHTERFHEHLDGCPRCANNPFDLCAWGAELLTQTVLDPHYGVREAESAGSPNVSPVGGKAENPNSKYPTSTTGGSRNEE